MSAPELISFTAEELVVGIGEAGLPVRVEHIDVPGSGYLAPQRAPGSVTIGAVRSGWELAELFTDEDETEARYRCTEQRGLEYAIRNSFGGTWQQRHLLTNTSEEPIQLDELVLGLAPATGRIAWVTTIPGATSWTVLPDQGTGPLLSAELTQGVVIADDDHGFRTPPVVLMPGRRHVLQWRIGFRSSAAEVVAHARPGLSGWTALPVGTPYEIADPDTAVLAEDPLMVRREESIQVVLSEQPGRHPVELRSARGTSRFDLAWVPSIDQLITASTDNWLAGEHSTAGVPLLPSSGVALGLQHALVARLTDRGEDIDEALALHAARMLDRDRLPILDLAFLAQEAIRTGDVDAVDRCRSSLTEFTEPQPGLGLAAIRCCLAELALGGDPTMIISHLRDIASATDDVRTGGLERSAARLELITVAGPAVDRDNLLDRLLGVGAQLGSGLPGRRLGVQQPATEIYAAAILDLVPDDLGPAVSERWPLSPHLLAERIRMAALAELLWPVHDGPAVGRMEEAIGWLVLGGLVRT